MEYKKVINENYQIHSKDLLLELETLIKAKINSDSWDCNVIVACEHRKATQNTLEDIFNIKEIDENFDKITSIDISFFDQNSNNKILTSIYNREYDKSIRCAVYSDKEDFVLGIYAILDKFIKSKFIKPIELLINDVKDNDNSNVKTLSKAKIVTQKKDLDYEFISLSLNIDDFMDIESLLLQDINNIKEYSINVVPNEKYLKKKQKAPEYTFYSVNEFSSNDDLLKKINHYSIIIKLKTDEICCNIKLINELLSRSYIQASGDNQTLYYGKFALLGNFFKTKKNWYFPMYFNWFLVMYIMGMSWIFVISSYVTKELLAKTFNFSQTLFLLIMFTFNIMLFKIFPKIKFNLVQKPKWYQNQTFQFACLAFLALLSAIGAFVKK